jgi:hypothetical protein
VGNFKDFLPIFEHARNFYGMPISVHYAEVENDLESEVRGGGKRRKKARERFSHLSVGHPQL